MQSLTNLRISVLPQFKLVSHSSPQPGKDNGETLCTAHYFWLSENWQKYVLGCFVITLRLFMSKACLRHVRECVFVCSLLECRRTTAVRSYLQNVHFQSTGGLCAQTPRQPQLLCFDSSTVTVLGISTYPCRLASGSF